MEHETRIEMMEKILTVLVYYHPPGHVSTNPPTLKDSVVSIPQPVSYQSESRPNIDILRALTNREIEKPHSEFPGELDSPEEGWKISIRTAPGDAPTQDMKAAIGSPKEARVLASSVEEITQGRIKIAPNEFKWHTDLCGAEWLLGS